MDGEKKKGLLGKIMGKKKESDVDPLSRSKHGKGKGVGDMLSKSFHGKKKNVKLDGADPLGRSTHGRAKKNALPKGV